MFVPLSACLRRRWPRRRWPSWPLASGRWPRSRWPRSRWPRPGPPTAVPQSLCSCMRMDSRCLMLVCLSCIRCLCSRSYHVSVCVRRAMHSLCTHLSCRSVCVSSSLCDSNEFVLRPSETRGARKMFPTLCERPPWALGLSSAKHRMREITDFF
jgi:hypothetical protein